MTPSILAAVDRAFVKRHSGLFARLAFSEMADALKRIGFTERDHDDLSDRHIQGCVYLYRNGAPFTWVKEPKDGPITRPTHQYVSLLSFEGRFTEAVIEVLESPKTRKGGRQVPALCTIVRDDPVTKVCALDGILSRLQSSSTDPTP